jgi:hypothetical protein
MSSRNWAQSLGGDREDLQSLALFPVELPAEDEWAAMQHSLTKPAHA